MQKNGIHTCFKKLVNLQTNILQLNYSITAQSFQYQRLSIAPFAQALWSNARLSK